MSEGEEERLSYQELRLKVKDWTYNRLMVPMMIVANVKFVFAYLQQRDIPHEDFSGPDDHVKCLYVDVSETTFPLL